MKICPIAIVAGCKKCPIYKPCPLKGVLGDYDGSSSDSDDSKKNESTEKPAPNDS